MRPALSLSAVLLAVLMAGNAAQAQAPSSQSLGGAKPINPGSALPNPTVPKVQTPVPPKPPVVQPARPATPPRARQHQDRPQKEQTSQEKRDQKMRDISKGLLDGLLGR